MIPALLAAALLAQGETRVSATAGTPFSSLRAERGFGFLTAEAGVDLAAFIRPVLGVRARILDTGRFALSAALLAGRVFPVRQTEIATARTWDGEASLRAELTAGPAVLLAQAAAVGQSDLKVEHSILFGEYLGGVDLAVKGPLWLLARAGVRVRTFETRATGWAGAALRW